MAVTNYYTIDGQFLGQQVLGEAEGKDYLLDAFGNILDSWNISFYNFTWGGGFGYRQTFTEWSSVYVRARHYSKAVGSWLTVDPLWPVEMPYGYVNGRVPGSVDPSGAHPCDARTKAYCAAAEKMKRGDFGLNCFCYVSGQMCELAKGNLRFDSTALKAGLLFKKLGISPIDFIKTCKGWAECFNKCLFDCVADGIGCGPGTQGFLGRNGKIGGSPRADSPCYQVDCFPTSDAVREKCCSDRVSLEQTQLTHCASGACSSSDKIVKGTKLVPMSFAGIPSTGVVPVTKGYKCSDLMSRIAEETGKPFRFAGKTNERINDARRNCCKRSTAVWR